VARAEPGILGREQHHPHRRRPTVMVARYAGATALPPVAAGLSVAPSRETARVPATADAVAPTVAPLADWARALRLHHWPKGAVVLVGLLPTAGFLRPPLVASALAAAALFQAAAAAGYLVNDLLDARRDRLHPRKRSRPIAAGRISPLAAGVAAVTIAAGAVGGAWALSPPLALVLAGYLALTLVYSLLLKHVVVLDVLMIAGVFVLRAVAGVVVIDAWVSPWFLASVGCLALLLALGKRLSEARLLSETQLVHRVVLRKYQAPMWKRMLSLVATATIASYGVAAACSPTAVAHPWLMASVLPVFLGVWRYTRLVAGGEGGQPERLLVRDRWMLAAAIGWVAVMALAILR
jgi:decaprenyl-phosphate phosphoribosyltransferase